MGPFKIYYSDGEQVKIVESAECLGSVLNRKIDAASEIKRRIGMGFARADDLRRLWKGTGTSRKRTGTHGLISRNQNYLCSGNLKYYNKRRKQN